MLFVMENATTDTQVREAFDGAVARAVDPEVRAKLELAREYFCDPAFRAKLDAFTWEEAQKKTG